jgi:hypothetical protein
LHDFYLIFYLIIRSTNALKNAEVRRSSKRTYSYDFQLGLDQNVVDNIDAGLAPIQDIYVTFTPKQKLSHKTELGHAWYGGFRAVNAM